MFYYIFTGDIYVWMFSVCLFCHQRARGMSQAHAEEMGDGWVLRVFCVCVCEPLAAKIWCSTLAKTIRRWWNGVTTLVSILSSWCNYVCTFTAVGAQICTIKLCRCWMVGTWARVKWSRQYWVLPRMVFVLCAITEPWGRITTFKKQCKTVYWTVVNLQWRSNPWIKRYLKRDRELWNKPR